MKRNNKDSSKNKKPENKKTFSERKEILWRVFIGIVSGIILGVWGYLIFVLTIFNWVYVLITDKRMKQVAEMCEIWNTQVYTYLGYLTMITNKRPFPFNELKKNLSTFK